MEGKVDELKKPLVSPKGVENDRGKHQDLLGGYIDLVVKLVYLIFVPLRLREVYLTDGLSRRFTHFALCAFLLLLSHLKLSKIIGCHFCIFLMLPAIIGSLATYEWDLELCIGVVGGLVLFIIILFVVMICGKNDDCKGIPLSA